MKRSSYSHHIYIYMVCSFLSCDYVISVEYCEKRFIRGEPIFVDFVGQPNNEFMNPMKYIFVLNYATILMIPYFS